MKWIIGIFFIIVFYSPSIVGDTFDNNLSESKKGIEDIISGKIKFSKDKNISKLSFVKEKKPKSSNVLIPEKPPILLVDQKTNEKYHKSMQAYYDYKIRGFIHRSKVFEWQLYSSKLLFVIVLLLVFSGIILSALQFYAGYKEQQNNILSTEFSASIKGIKISSPVIGLIILALSLGFFYLYLVYIFPIEEIF